MLRPGATAWDAFCWRYEHGADEPELWDIDERDRDDDVGEYP